MSPTCWPCSTTTWLSGNIHQHLIALVTTPPPTRKPHLPHPPVGPTSPLNFPGYWSPPLPLSPSSSVSSLHSDTACREVPASLQAALDRTQKKTCQLLLEELLLDLQVRLSPAPAAGRAAAKSASARPTLLHAQAWAYSCPGSLRRTLWPPIILQTSLPAWLPDLDKPPAAHSMSVTSQHHPVSLGQMVWAPKSLTDRDWEPQSPQGCLMLLFMVISWQKTNRREATSVQRIQAHV